MICFTTYLACAYIKDMVSRIRSHMAIHNLDKVLWCAKIYPPAAVSPKLVRVTP
jgi:hypothetical protein